MANLAVLEDQLAILSTPLGVAAYDFDFDLHFDCRHPYRIEAELPCLLRIGAVHDYAATYSEQLERGLRLVNSPVQHALASELEHWYPHIADLTPRSRIYPAMPEAAEVEADFGWPVFLKGSRQTSRHDPGLALIASREHYERAMRLYRTDPILHWQKPVLREFVALAPVAGAVPGKISPSLEYRSFWWQGQCIGWGRYWYQVPAYDCPEPTAGLAIAREVAERLQVPFLVVDMARTAAGRWIVIECNDGQEAGHAGIPPLQLWRNVLAAMGGSYP